MEHAIATIPLKENVSLIEVLVFSIKVRFNLIKRFIRNLFEPVAKHAKGESLVKANYKVNSSSPLWNANDTEKNWILTAGKVENLRVACKLLNGIEIEANSIFSFWNQIGAPSSSKGFTIGREIREGCIVPTIAGGLCQLTNALYDCALKMNLEIVERHRHSKVVKGSLAEIDRDATVKWNYIDLRFKSTVKFRIEAELSEDELIVSFKTEEEIEKSPKISSPQNIHKLNDCFSCGNIKCVKHPKKLHEKQKNALKVYLLDEYIGEHIDYVKTTVCDKDLILTTQKFWKNTLGVKVDFYNFSFPTRIAFFKRRLTDEVAFKTKIDLNKKIALTLIRKIPINCNHIVISQSLLPFAIESGALGGRTYEVIASSLPISEIQARLDLAASIHPQVENLNNFRTSDLHVNNEYKGLEKASKIISVNKDIQNLFSTKYIPIDWNITNHQNENESTKDVILFPNKLMARYGSEEIIRLSKELNLEIHCIESEMNNSKKINQFDGNWHKVRLVCNPAYSQSYNKIILQALERNIPVLTTKGCGVSHNELVTEIEVGNFEDTKQKMNWILQKTG